MLNIIDFYYLLPTCTMRHVEMGLIHIASRITPNGGTPEKKIQYPEQYKQVLVRLKNISLECID